MGRTCGVAQTPMHSPHPPHPQWKPPAPPPQPQCQPAAPPAPQPTQGVAGEGGGPDRPSFPQPVRRHPTDIHGGPVGCGCGWRGVGPSFPRPSRSQGKFCSPLPNLPTLRVWGSGRQRTSPHMGGGCTRARQDGGAGNPEPGPDEGPTVFPVSIWGGGALHRLPSTDRPSEKHFTND